MTQKPSIKRPIITYGLLVLATGYSLFSTTEYLDIKSSYATERKANDKLLTQYEDLSEDMDALDEKFQDLSEKHAERGKTISYQKEKLQQLQSQSQYQAQELEELKTERQALLQEVQRLKDQAPPPTETETLPVSTSSVTKEPSVSMNFQATAYVATGNPTASGIMPTVGRTIATDPSVIPTGSKVQITIPSHPQYNGVYVAEDTGGAINGNIIDLFVAGHAEAVSFGRQPIRLEIISQPS